MNKDEWQARVDLAACYHLCALHGWDDVIYTHISAVVPGEAGRYLINPFGLRFEEVCASNVVKVDGDGNPVDAAQYDINRPGFALHAAVHGARHDTGQNLRHPAQGAIRRRQAAYATARNLPEDASATAGRRQPGRTPRMARSVAQTG
ncbi:hypothetical protein RugamoR1_05770 [Rugamonas sp. R1(2021)]